MSRIYILDNNYIFQDVDQDVLSEFQRSPLFKGMATNWMHNRYPLNYHGICVMYITVARLKICFLLGYN